MCQCPERGDLHFYDYLKKLTRASFTCVNALKGATSISTRVVYTDRRGGDSVSMP